MKKRCLISGAGGLIGSHLIKEMLEEFEIYALLKNEHLFEDCSDTNLHFLESDLTQNNFTDRIPKRMDIVIHLAQSPHYREFPEKALDVFGVNSTACLRLLDYAKNAGVEKFILASSGVVYGEGQRKFSEDENIVIPSKNLGFYHTTKLCAELLAENYTKYMTVTILRFFFVYGEGQKKSMLLPRLVESVMSENPILLQGCKGIHINPIHVSDAAAAIQKAIHLSESHKINVGGSEILSLREIGEIIGSSLGKAPVFEVDTQATPTDMIGNIEKMKRLLTIPTISFQRGIRNYIEYTYPDYTFKTPSELCLSPS